MQMAPFRIVSEKEGVVPGRLRNFLIQMESAGSSEAVWQAIVELSQKIGLPLVDYVCATDYRDWQKAQFIRTTVSSDWIEHARTNPNIRKMSYFRTHAVRYMTPIYVGLAYADMHDPTPERLEIMKLSASVGLNAGIGIPLRMSTPGQAAILIFGGPQSREEFEELIAREGWTLHAAAMAAHIKYMELFKGEFLERNSLNQRHRELIILVGQGLQDKQISHELGISVSAVRQRLASVQARTGASNRAALAALAAQIGLVCDPQLKTHETDLTVFLSTGDGVTGAETELDHN